MIKILIAEDEAKLRYVVAGYLKNEGYSVTEAQDGEDALEKFYSDHFSLVILDVMMPNMDGYEACQEIRKVSDVPIIMLTARNTEFDELMGFKKGADEYISKPFSPKILVTRVKSILKRAGLLQDSECVIGDLKIVYREHCVYYQNKKISLTPREYDLLCYLVANKNIVLSREQILQAVWGLDYEGEARTVDTHIKCLRIKIPAAQQWIKTIRKCGYKFEAPNEMES